MHSKQGFNWLITSCISLSNRRSPPTRLSTAPPNTSRSIGGLYTGLFASARSLLLHPFIQRNNTADMQLVNAQRSAATAGRTSTQRRWAAQRLVTGPRAYGNGNGSSSTSIAVSYRSTSLVECPALGAAPADSTYVVLAVAQLVPSSPAAIDVTPVKGLEIFETSSRNAYLTRRHELVLKHFPNALGVDDFMSRVEIALSAHGFRGDNSIGESQKRQTQQVLGGQVPRTRRQCRGAAAWIQPEGSL